MSQGKGKNKRDNSERKGQKNCTEQDSIGGNFPLQEGKRVKLQSRKGPKKKHPAIERTKNSPDRQT